MAMHTGSNVRNDTTTDRIRRIAPMLRASSGLILPEGTGLSGWAVLSISRSM